MISKIIEEYFGESYDLISCPIDNYVIIETTLMSILYRLGLECKIFKEDLEDKSWLFNPKNIDNNI